METFTHIQQTVTWTEKFTWLVVVIKWELYVSINIADVQKFHYNLNKEWQAHCLNTYIHTDMEATYFWDRTWFPFFTGWVVQHHRQCTEPCQMAEVFVGLGTFRDRKRGIWKKKKKWKEALCRHLWSVSVTAWLAISSSPTAAVSCAAGKRPTRPPAPRTLAVGAGGPCSTWPHPGMTSAGRGKWTGRGGGGTVSSRRLCTEKMRTGFSQFWFGNEWRCLSHAQICFSPKRTPGIDVRI